MEIPPFFRKSDRRRWKYPHFPEKVAVADGNTHFFVSLAPFPMETATFFRRWHYFRRKQPLFRVVGLISGGYSRFFVSLALFPTATGPPVRRRARFLMVRLRVHISMLIYLAGPLPPPPHMKSSSSSSMFVLRLRTLDCSNCVWCCSRTTCIEGFIYAFFFIVLSSVYLMTIFLPALIYTPLLLGLPLSLRPSRLYHAQPLPSHAGEGSGVGSVIS